MMEGEEETVLSHSWLHCTSWMTDWLHSMTLTRWLLLAVLALILLSIWDWYKSINYFKKMGVPCPSSLPFIGISLDFLKWGVAETLNRYTKKYGKIYGLPWRLGFSLVISDVEMLKEIFVKKFQYFPDRMSKRMNYKPWKDSLLFLCGDHWKHVRSNLSPTFSSGKIKRMIPAIQHVAATLKDHLSDAAAKGELVELKEVCGRFSMDVIGLAAFGIDVSSIQNPDSEFVKKGLSLVNPNKLEIALSALSPKMLDFCRKWGLLSTFKEAADFFENMVDKALKERQMDMQSQKYHDFLQLLVESTSEGEGQGQVDSEINHEDQLATSEKWTRKGLTKDEMISNSFLFIVGGFETVSTAMSFTLFCLANNPECLKEAQAEVDSKVGKKVVTYELASSLTYLDMCINEALRLYPPGFVLTRVAAEDVEIGGVKIPKKTDILIPVGSLHKDPQFWPEPEKFDPLRHTSEARAERHPFSFMPFGLGPRNCIAMRLAQLEVRIAVAVVLQYFTPVVCEKTVYPAKPAKIQMKAVDGLWVRFKKRE